jgi:deoxyribodipyrimidine photolyase
MSDSAAPTGSKSGKSSRQRRRAARRRGIASLEGDDGKAVQAAAPRRRPQKKPATSAAAKGESEKEPLFIVWYRWSDLRLLDHEPLVEAEKAAAVLARRQKGSKATARVLHLHVVEHELLAGKSHIAGIRRCSLRRALFWCESVEGLGHCLSDLTSGQQELVVAHGHAPTEMRQYGQPAHYASVAAVFATLLQKVEASGRRIGGIYAHQGFCDEEVQTEGQIRSLLVKHGLTGADLRLFWGGQTLHHVDDLGLKLETTTTPSKGTTISMQNPEHMPQFKGEFNKLCKGKRVRRPLAVPYDGRNGGQASVGAGQPTGLQDWLLTGPEEDGSAVSFRACSRGGNTVRGLFESLLFLPPGVLERAVRRFDPDSIASSWADNHARQGRSSAKPFGRSTFLFPDPHGVATADGGCEENADRACNRWPGGESAALAYLRKLVWETNPPALAMYKGATESFNHSVGEADNTPINAGTRLSPYLAFGNLSVRTVMAEVRRWEQSNQNYGKQIGRVSRSVPPTKRLYQELIFRDFLRLSCLRWGVDLFKVGGPFRVRGLVWRRPQRGVGAAEGGAGNSDPVACDFRRWQQGQTGMPFVDAGMRELALTGFMSHLHRQCCAAFLVRDLGIDWRMGAEHFESCLLDHTPDANWGNWAYRILPRPCLVPGLQIMAAGDIGAVMLPFEASSSSSRRGRGGKRKGRHRARPNSEKTATSASQAPGSERVSASSRQRTQTTLECTTWPMIHDAKAKHTLAWVPELRNALHVHQSRMKGKALNFELSREPWRNHIVSSQIVDIKPYKDSPLWFCAANRVNWDYEYGWFSGRGMRVIALQRQAAVDLEWTGDTTTEDGGEAQPASGEAAFRLGRDYPFPLVLPVTPSIGHEELPVRQCWAGDGGAVADAGLEPISGAAIAAVRDAVALAVDAAR